MALLDMSDELLDQICKYLVPELDVPLGSYESEFSSSPFDDGRLSLLSITKTNGRLRAVATRHLYHTICICDLRTLFDVLGTFFSFPHLAEHVRILIIVASLVDSLDNETDEKAERVFASIIEDSRAHGLLERCFGEFEQASSLTWNNVDDYQELSCALLMCLAVNTHTLCMHCPNWNVTEYDALMEVFERCHQGGVEFLPSLSRLYLCADPGVSDPLLPAALPQAFMGPGGVKHLQLFGANLFRNDIPFLEDKWRGVEILETGYAYTTGEWWFRLCDVARPPLKEIDISMSPYFSESGIQEEPGLNEALRLCADTIERIRLDVVGPSQRLSCLPFLTKLTKLECSITLLFESRAAMRRRNICDMLPLSLERLEFDEESVDTDDPWPEEKEPDGFQSRRTDYKELLRRAMVQLVFQSREKLPNLKDIRLAVSRSCWDWVDLELDAACKVERERPSAIYMFFTPE